MKTPSDDLFTLIKSLDTQEKVFFKVYSVKRGYTKHSRSYLRLFDIIDMLKIYDEQLLKAKLKKIGFTHRLKNAKSYLTEAIINSLEEYHSNISVNAELQKLLLRVELFVKKKLPALARKMLLKAEKLAMEHEADDYLPAVYSLKKSILHSNRNIEDMENHINYEALKEKQCMKRLKNTIEFRNLDLQVQIIANTSSIEAKGIYHNKINSILKSPLLSSPDKALSFSALLNYYSIHLFCSQLLNKWDYATYQRQKEWLNYLESDKTKFDERTQGYFAALINLMVIQMKMHKSGEVEKSYQKIKKFYLSVTPKKRTKVMLSSFVNAAFNYIGIHIDMGNPAKSLEVWEQIKDLVSFNKLDNSLLVFLYDNLSRCYFMLENYHEALKWINKVLDFKKKNLLNTQAMARIYLLLVHYELGNYDTLPYLAKSSKRFSIKHNYFFELEKIMIIFFEKKIHKTNNQQDQSETFRQLKKQLETLVKDTKQIQSLEYFDYLSWIESKIENRTFAEVVREKASIASKEK